jgi:recombinational DNA repair ATPase RecF
MPIDEIKMHGASGQPVLLIDEFLCTMDEQLQRTPAVIHHFREEYPQRQHKVD